MDPALQSSEVSKGLKKKRLLGIEMLWHVNELGFAVQGQHGPMCKVYGGGISASCFATRLYRMLEDPSRFSDGQRDLVKWVKCDVEGKEQHIIRVRSFDEWTKLKEEMHFPHLRDWLAGNRFLAVFPPGVDLKNNVIDADKDPRESLTACSGQGDIKLSTGELHYFSNQFQPGNIFGIYQLERDNSRRKIVSHLEGNLAERVFNAYLSSLKKPLWDADKVPITTVANRLAMLVATVMDVEVSTLTRQLSAKLEEHGRNATNLSVTDEDEALMASMREMERRGRKGYT